MDIADEQGIIDAAKEDAMALGMDKGMEKAKLETAVNFLREGVDIAMVAKCTGLSILEIKILKKNLN